MPKDMRKFIALLALGSLTGCHAMVPQWQLRQAQLRSYEYFQSNQQLAADLGSTQQWAGQLAMEKQGLEARTAELERDLKIANQRLSNLASERSKLHNEYKTLLTSLPAPNAPLSASVNSQLAAFCRKYPEFEFDPISGVARFQGELKFTTGSSQIRPENVPMLQDIARVLNSDDARMFNVLVVGHTDDRPVVQPGTRALHETNWELSAHRATVIVRQLAKFGVSEPRMGVAGYSQFHPAVPNSNDKDRQINRRVEIFVLAADTAIASKDDKKTK